jgi:hypothetical protein
MEPGLRFGLATGNQIWSWRHLSDVYQSSRDDSARGNKFETVGHTRLFLNLIRPKDPTGR